MPPPSSDATRSNITAGRSLLAWPIERLVSRLPRRCDAGRLSIRLPSGIEFMCDSNTAGPVARVEVARWRGLSRIALGGNIGFARAFIDADCDCSDLDALFAWGLANENLLGSFSASSGLPGWFGQLQHLRNANTLRGSRRNIAAHYDLGNDFYGHWLDTGMSYSSGLYGANEQLSLEAAQEAKLDRIVELLDLSGNERVLEIGCGWGALAERLAGGAAAHLTGLTLSERQLHYTGKRLEAAGRSGHAEIRLQDYREVEGTFDRIASIEMLEAVGERYWPAYFDVLRRRLVPGGSAVLQVITIRDDRFSAYAREPDFIQRYIFPGGMLPTIPIIREQIDRAGLRLESLELFGDSYAGTLREWRSRFIVAWPRLTQLGFDERFRRMWLYYLAYCEAGFRAGETDVGLYRITRARD